jgi:hypothetical protein
LAAIAAVVAAKKGPSFNDDTYFGLPALEKANQIWESVIEDTKSNGWYSAVSMGGIFTESMEPTLHTPGDAMPKGTLYGTRSKLIHSVGSIA